MKRFLIITLCLLIIGSAACAESYDPRNSAMNMLTEVFGYTEDEVSQFIFDDNGVGTMKYYPADHPNWIYVLTYNGDRWLDATTPFKTAYEAYPGEGAVRETLRMAKENKWFTEWTPANREALRAYMENWNGIHIRRPFLNLLGMDEADPAQIINEFFACCYGEESGWPIALIEWRNKVLAQYGVSINIVGNVPASGITAFTLEKGMYLQQTEVYEFKGEVPDELAAVFSREPNLSGWTCVCGAMQHADYVNQKFPDTLGLAAFEKDGQRQLVVIDRINGIWSLLPLGTKALYQDPAMELSINYDPANSSDFIIRYDCADGVRQFHVSINAPSDDLCGHYAFCEIRKYRYVSGNQQDSLWIDLEWSTGLWTYTAQHGSDMKKDSGEVCFSCWLGVCDIADFPDSIEKMRAIPNLLPEGCAVAGGVHFRKDHSSRSKELGTLKSGTIIQIKDRVPGDPFEWIHTSIGAINGYVASNYTSLGSDTIHINMEYPLPIAVCANSLRLQSDTGLFNKTVSELPAGTKMHIIMDQGDWLYVDVPRGDISWLMDVDGTYGYIRKSDVKVVAIESYLDWE